jgi:hypothetical protein
MNWFRIVLALLLLGGSCYAQNATTSANVTLVWESNTESDLAGYKLYQSDTGTGGPFDQCVEEKIPPSGKPEVTYPTMITIGVGQTLCFAVTAFNSGGAESGISNVVCHADQSCVPLSPKTRAQACPAGQSGSITETSRSTCPGPAWGPWVITNNTCKSAACVAGTETRNLACPAGRTGNISESRTSTCPNPTGTPVWGAWAQTNNTCTQTQACTTHTETRTVKCAWWYKGSTTQRRTSTCQNGQEVWGPWVTASSTCAPWWKR